jgi:cell wall-associated protease
MNNFKPIFISAFAVLVLAGCGASRNASNSTALMIQAPVNVQKKTALKEADLNRWSHLDIIKDTIPGMSVDRAYAELLKDKKSKKVIVGIVDSGVDIEHED